MAAQPCHKSAVAIVHPSSQHLISKSAFVVVIQPTKWVKPERERYTRVPQVMTAHHSILNPL